MKSLFIYCPIVIILFIGCKDKQLNSNIGSFVASGEMPNLVKDQTGIIHLVYGSRDSIIYSFSEDQGESFSSQSLVGILPDLAASHMRGPQIAATRYGITVIACNSAGDIFSYSKEKNENWQQPIKVNDVDTVAKEGLMALGGDGETLFAAWLDLRENKQNKIVGAQSLDGGKSWSKNILVYASPDTTVCECCKPSVVIKGNDIYVMFRNWLNGNRDLYLIKSANSGNSFETAQKLGMGSWALNGCPMDGGGLTINTSKAVQTVWNRQGTIYACEPEKQEVEIGKGRSCTIESVSGKNVYAWTKDGHIIIRKPQGIQVDLGKGQLPLLKAINNEHVICVWESEGKIQKAILEL